jgi:pyruvate/2-oxoglutarate dehydrogenase complex dihydrolipoamide dehydrogenase (E3) component
MSEFTLLPDDLHNRTHLANVHPVDWVNPQPAPQYNLAVLGGGPAGLVCAAAASGLGAKVALIESGLLGGDCLNVGCVPSKAIIRSARSMADVRDAGQFGVEVPSGVRMNFAGVMERMRRLRASLSPVDSAARYRSLGVDVFLGRGRFSGRNSVEVAGQTVRFRKAIIATGARAASPDIPGLAEIGYLTNETVFTLTDLPRRLAVIGAGPIGCELAQAFARCGSRVYLIEALHGIMPNEDRDASELVRASLERDGIQLMCCGKHLVASQSPDGAKRLTLDSHDAHYELTVDEVLVGAGRVPNVDGLNLELSEVEYDPKTGIRVNDRLQTSNSRIFAAGDVCSRYRFTHMADAMARMVVQNALFFGRAKLSALTVPWCTYTDPELAHVGLSDHEARARGVRVNTFVQPFQHVDRAVLDGETEGLVKVHVGAGCYKIVGATIVARHAGEMISELTLAMVGRLGLKTIAGTVHPYPTQAEAIRKVADTYNRSRLTPWVKSLFQRWFAWNR